MMVVSNGKLALNNGKIVRTMRVLSNGKFISAITVDIKRVVIQMR